MRWRRRLAEEDVKALEGILAVVEEQKEGYKFMYLRIKGELAKIEHELATLRADQGTNERTKQRHLNRIELLEEIIRALRGPEMTPCSYDHHGNCQEHNGDMADGQCATKRSWAVIPE